MKTTSQTNYTPYQLKLPLELSTVIEKISEEEELRRKLKKFSEEISGEFQSKFRIIFGGPAGVFAEGRTPLSKNTA